MVKMRTNGKSPWLAMMAPTVMVLVGVTLTSCGSVDEDASLVPPGAVGGVSRLTPPAGRSQTEIDALNTYRANAFSSLESLSKNVNHSKILYTSAYRHSVYVNTANSAEWNPTTLRGIEGDTYTASSSQDELREEPVVTATGATGATVYPAYRTALDPWNRVNAVVGGADFLKEITARGIKEYYLFDGDIQPDSSSSGGSSSSTTGERLRGFKRGTANLVDNLWYTRKGRLALLRPNLVAVGIAQHDDFQEGQVVEPPWPYLDGRFIGSMVCAYARPEQRQLTIWPRNGMTGVRTSGLDTDVKTLVNVGSSGLTADAVVPHAYSGPPISVTLPINTPFFQNPEFVVGGVTVGFRKLERDPYTNGVQSPPAAQVSTYVMAMFAVPPSGAGGGATSVVFSSVSQATDANYQYSVVGATLTTTAGSTTGGVIQDDELRYGDLVIIPTGPLEPKSWYEVAVRLRSVAPEPWDDFPGTQETRLETRVNAAGEAIDSTYLADGFYQFRFKTQ